MMILGGVEMPERSSRTVVVLTIVVFLALSLFSIGGALASKCVVQQRINSEGGIVLSTLLSDSGVREASEDFGSSDNRSAFLAPAIQNGDLAISRASGNQGPAHLAYNSVNNEYLLVWWDERHKSTTGREIYGQLVSPMGDLKGSEFAITSAPGDQEYPDVAYNSADNEYLVVWGDSSSKSIYGQRVSNTGKLQADGFVIAATPAGPENPRIAYNNTSNAYLVVWRAGDFLQGQSDIYGQLLSGEGNLQGSGISISTANGNQLNPAIAYNSVDNEYLVVWQDDRATSGNTIRVDVYGQRISHTGTLKGSASAISPTFGQDWEQLPDAVHSRANNEYLVVWMDDRHYPEVDIYAQLVTNTGSPKGSGFAISTAGGEQTSPDVVYNSIDKEYLVVWEDERGSSEDIYGQYVSDSGKLQDSNFAISTARDDQDVPEVDHNNTDNEYLVTWSDDRNKSATGGDIYAKLIPGKTPVSTNGERILMSLPEVTAAPGETITVPITVTDATGISGADIVVTYDGDVLTVDEVKTTALSSGMILAANTDTPGEVAISMASVEAITGGSGSLADIVFTVSASAKAGAVIPLSFKQAELYSELGDSLPVDTQDGRITIRSCVKGDVNGDGEIKANDAILALRISAGLMTPTPQQECAADVNSDGRVRSNDAIMILRMVTGVAAPDSGVVGCDSRQITVALTEAYGVIGESITVPVKVDNFDILAGGDICIAYDNSVLRAVDVSSHPNILLVSNLAEPGMVRIAFAGVDRLSSRTLAQVQFDVATDDVSPLKLRKVELYGSDALPLISRSVDKEFRSWAMPPAHSALLQNYPNPFNPETRIPYQLKEGTDVAIRIYSATGELVRELSLGYKPAGLYVSSDRTAYWNGRNEAGEQVSSGVYFYTVQAGEFTATRKMLMLK